MTNWEIVQTFHDLQIAHIWRSRLEAEGIPAQVIDKSNSSYGIPSIGYSNPEGTIDLWVPLELASKAVLLLD